MKIFEYGNKNGEHILLLHPMLLDSEYMVNFFREFSNYHIIAPDYSAHGSQIGIPFNSIYTEIDDLAHYLIENKYFSFSMAIGFSLGGRGLLELINNNNFSFNCIILDGTPLLPNYELLEFISNL